jgi:DNA-directed RNA polymerase sigma subunit (sigma70/sigma32)
VAEDADDRHEELLRRYLTELDGQPQLTAEQEVELGRLVRSGDTEASQQLVQANLRLVVALARRYTATGMPLLDLIQDGNLGLMHAVDAYEPDRGFAFRTFAMWWIRQAITKGIANAGRGQLRASAPDGAVESQLQDAWDAYVSAHGRQPTLAELAAESGLTEARVTELLGSPPGPPDDGPEHDVR